MEGNQNSNPLDYSQSGVVYKDLNGNGTAPSNIKSNEFVDQNGIKSPSAPLGQVTKKKHKFMCMCLCVCVIYPAFAHTKTPQKFPSSYESRVIPTEREAEQKNNVHG